MQFKDYIPVFRKNRFSDEYSFVDHIPQTKQNKDEKFPYKEGLYVENDKLYYINNIDQYLIDEKISSIVLHCDIIPEEDIIYNTDGTMTFIGNPRSTNYINPQKQHFKQIVRTLNKMERILRKYANDNQKKYVYSKIGYTNFQEFKSYFALPSVRKSKDGWTFDRYPRFKSNGLEFDLKFDDELARDYIEIYDKVENKKFRTSINRINFIESPIKSE